MNLPQLDGRRVLLGVSGGIAAYKAAELCRLLVRAGARVQVMMTAAGRRFVGETTFAALSGHLVATDLFDPLQEEQIGHISLADEAELLLLAPATANLLAKLAHGLADDLVSTVYLAYEGPVLLAPAMNVHMWSHPATVANVATLKQRGHVLVGPADGEMACGHVGRGRMVEPIEIFTAAAACLGQRAERDLEGLRILISAGPTREPIDPVRFVGNRSSGRMGYALAEAAHDRGAQVVLVTGPAALAPPAGVEVVSVTTASQMAREIHARADAQQVIVMAAAVADYRPVSASASKIKKGPDDQRVTLELERTEDILATLGARPRRPLLVGFAAETAADAPELDALARAKLAAKGCDLLVANNVLEQDAGFEVGTNRVVIYDRGGGRDALELMDKRTVADRIFDRVRQQLAAGQGPSDERRS